MSLVKPAVIAFMIALLTACSTPQERAADAQAGAYNAQEDVAKRRIQLVDQYQSCIKDAGGDQQKAASCDSLLKAAEALK